MIQRQRIYELILGDTKTRDAVSITDLHITLDVVKSSSNKRKSNSATIEVYNLSDATLAKLETEFLAAQLSCGYLETGLTKLISGQVTGVSTRKNGPDKVTQILLGEGYVELNKHYLKAITPQGSTVEDTIEEIRKQMPGVIRGAYSGLNIRNEILYGYPLTGTPRQMLNELAEAHNLEYRVDRGVLYVTDDGGITDRNLQGAFVISEDTGLIDVPYKTTKAAKKPKGAPKGTKAYRRGIQFKALLNGKIIPGSPIRLESQLITGWFKVIDCRYFGGYNDNDWYVEAYCEEILKEDIPNEAS